MTDFEIVGMDKLLRILADGGPAAVDAVRREIYMEAQEAFAASQALVPVDTGALRASGHVKGPTEDASGITVEIAYGGVAAPYAEVVHEDLAANHASPTGAKYLETPVARAAGGMGERIAAAVRRAIGA